ncbi:MAG TPA: hypothetical protein VD969_04335 [Symbiobacteriaceae bacterium]|nr:hypothetical protein [Symbiobacteriaceae bacterium]
MLNNYKPEAAGPIVEAIRRNDRATALRLLDEQVEKAEGREKAFWLATRANMRKQIGTPEQHSAAEADWQEAYRLDKDNPLFVLMLIHDAVASQRLDQLRNLPKSTRTRIRTELFDDWRFWNNVGFLHRFLRRWYPSYRANTKALKLYLALSPEQRKYDEGWILPLRCWHARAALRVGRIGEAIADVGQAEEIFRERPYISPMHLALAKADLAISQGDYPAAQEALYTGTAVLAQTPEQARPSPLVRLECLILAARISRAEGRVAGLRNFCEQALAIAVEAERPYTEREIRLIMDGADF